MSMWTRPALWWRILIVVSAATGLAIGVSSLVFFTIQSNVIVVAYFIGAAYWMLRRSTDDAPAPRWRGAVVLYISITGLVAHILLMHGASPFPGLTSGPNQLQNWADFFCHYVTPIMVVIDWLVFKPRNTSRLRDIPLWLCFPIGYTALVLVRAALFPNYPNRYPYPFFDVAAHGYTWVFGQIAVLAVEFTIIAVVVVGLDRLGTWVRERVGGSPPSSSGPEAEPITAAASRRVR